MMTENKETRKFYLNHRPYTGQAAFINGYNGFEHAEGDGTLCALLPNPGRVAQLSCWTYGIPNTLLDENNEPFIDWHRSGTNVYLFEGRIYRKRITVLLNEGCKVLSRRTKKVLEFHSAIPVIVDGWITDFQYILLDTEKKVKMIRQQELVQKFLKTWEITADI